MFSNPTFWVGVAFVLFFALLVYYGVPGQIFSSLDSRSTRIRDELAEATQLRQDAERLLKEYQAKRESAEREAAEIVANAREEAERLARETEAKLNDFVRRRTASAETKIAQAEAQAAAEVRAAAIEAAVKASERVLRAEMSGAAGEDLLARSLGEVRTRLQ